MDSHGLVTQYFLFQHEDKVCSFTFRVLYLIGSHRFYMSQTFNNGQNHPVYFPSCLRSTTLSPLYRVAGLGSETSRNALHSSTSLQQTLKQIRTVSCQRNRHVVTLTNWKQAISSKSYKLRPKGTILAMFCSVVSKPSMIGTLTHYFPGTIEPDKPLMHATAKVESDSMLDELLMLLVTGNIGAHEQLCECSSP